MCGRFAVISPVSELIEAFGLDPGSEAVTAHPELVRSRHNVAPTQLALVITDRNPKRLSAHRWGLLPPWAKDPKAGARMINARAETAAAKPSFRKPIQGQRCLVPADGFYEWQARGKTKVPHFIRRADRRLLALAGLWEVWHPGAESEVHSFTILTCPPNETLAPLHDRMPVLLPPEAWPRWLAPGPLPPAELASLFRPAPAGLLEAYPVSSRVNDPRADGPELIEPAD